MKIKNLKTLLDNTRVYNTTVARSSITATDDECQLFGCFFVRSQRPINKFVQTRNLGGGGRRDRSSPNDRIVVNNN